LATAASKEEVEAGSAMLKAVLQQWKSEVECEGLGKEAQVARMRQLVEGNSELLANPFFQTVKAL
jgi:DNA mismatch repair protein MSH2